LNGGEKAFLEAFPMHWKTEARLLSVKPNKKRELEAAQKLAETLKNNLQLRLRSAANRCYHRQSGMLAA
jgi:hypothetical protein